MKKYDVTSGSYERGSCDFEPVNAGVYEHLQTDAFYIRTDLQNGQSFRERLYTAVFEQMFHSNNCYLLFRASPDSAGGSAQSFDRTPFRNAAILSIVSFSVFPAKPTPAKFMCVAPSITPSHLHPAGIPS